MTKYDVIIIGGGPGGLACAKILSQAGTSVLLLERKKIIGDKVCAGGITWDGMIRKVPKDLIERTFNEQHVFSTSQKICYRKKEPIIATVNRRNLGQWMLQEAQQANVDIRAGWNVRQIEKGIITATDQKGALSRFNYDHLVGADGSSSMVRRFLGIPVKRYGTGINYQVSGNYPHMEWHLDTQLFGNGYGWIFPHRDTVSIGAYANSRFPSAGHLKKKLIHWGNLKGFALHTEQPRAERINFDFRGFHFGNTWLIGDAAGFASGLTGEGIHPAIVSGQAVAKKIIDPAYPAKEIQALIARKKTHEKMVRLTARNATICRILMESLVLMIRFKIIDFQKHLSM